MLKHEDDVEVITHYTPPVVLNSGVIATTKRRPAVDTKATARKRWKILAKALFGEDSEEVTDVSVRRFTSFGVFAPIFVDGEWLRYATNDGQCSIDVRQPPQPLTAEDLMGFNNTGNICVWPSEETLAVYVLTNLNDFADKSVLELGGGMSCLAGLVVAKYATPKSVYITDGNAKSVENVKHILKQNLLDKKVSCSVLQWENVSRNIRRCDVSKFYDIILVADCLFFEEVREDLIRTIHIYLSNIGVAYVMAPKRNDTLDKFVSMSEAFGFLCIKIEKYSDVVWKRHLELLKTDPYYDPSLHYPILIKMTKIV